MTNRQRFFAVLSEEHLDRAAFFPDITDWYASARTPPGQERPYGSGQFISDGDPIHRAHGTMPEEFAGMTFLDFYRRFGWGLPIHAYRWYDVEPGDVERTIAREGNVRTTRIRCPAGELIERHALAADGSWAPVEHPVKDIAHLKVVRHVVGQARWRPRFDLLEDLMRDIGPQGACDVVLPRSPFGKLVHMYMGFEQVVYNLFDHEAEMLDFLAFQEQRDLQLVRLAAQAPARVVIMSDHTDENLVSPSQYRRFCIPYYQQAAGILHAAGKVFSTHLDGNIRGYFPLLGETGFDLLDGCTPAPMMNYEVEQLARALPPNMRCYCGVPATLLCQNRPDEEILSFGRRILDAFGGRVILNVGDILPPNGDIRQVIRLGELAARYRN